MDKKLILGLVFIIVIMIPSVCAWSIFGNEVPENTDHIAIKNIETEWASYSDGFYGYTVDFVLFNFSSHHEIQSVISYYDSDGKLIKNDNLTEGITEPIFQGKPGDNVTITLEDEEKLYPNVPIHLKADITKFNYCEVDHIRIDIIDASEDKLLYTINQTFNMSNRWDPEDVSFDSDESDDSDSSDSKTSQSDRDYEFFKDTDYNGDGVIDFSEFSDISYVFTEDSFWDGYSTEEILQSEWDRANNDGDDYLTFDEFKNVI